MGSVNFAVFNKDFFKEYENCITWFNKKGILKLNQNVNAEITLVTGIVSGTYEGYRVKLVNKENGVITENYFGFNVYLKKRLDNRKEYINEFSIIEHCVKNNNDFWYIAIPDPKEVKEMAQTIISYIYMYE